MFELNFEVKRVRFSVTQGEAVVYLDGKEMARFADEIQLVDGEWQSVKTDEEFIRGLLFHPYDDVYQISQPLKGYLMKESDIKKISPEKVHQMIEQYDAYRESEDLNAKNEAEEGLFYAETENGRYVTVDNLDGYCNVEEFETEVEALCWLVAHDDLIRFKK